MSNSSEKIKNTREFINGIPDHDLEHHPQIFEMMKNTFSSSLSAYLKSVYGLTIFTKAQELYASDVNPYLLDYIDEAYQPLVNKLNSFLNDTFYSKEKIKELMYCDDEDKRQMYIIQFQQYIKLLEFIKDQSLLAVNQALSISKEAEYEKVRNTFKSIHEKIKIIPKLFDQIIDRLNYAILITKNYVIEKA